MDYITLEISSETLEKMETFYKEGLIFNVGEYILWKVKTIDEVSITAYSSKKGIKVVFSGLNALKEAQIWDLNAKVKEKKEKIEYTWLDVNDQIGSDEVGTGDFFGPVIVVASFVKKEDIEYLRSLKVNDSKKLSDEKILEIVPLILDKITFSKLTCTNEKYNQLIDRGYNMNKIKALLHNQALINVRNEINKSDINYFIDQFCDVDVYYHYLQHEKEVINKNTTFKTKGESQYPSIAISSMIARYCFLKEIDVIKEKYQVEILKGASTKVDKNALEFLNKYGLEELNKVVKKNFINYKNLTKEKDA
jgi:ribonuclease HIII